MKYIFGIVGGLGLIALYAWIYFKVSGVDPRRWLSGRRMIQNSLR